MENTNFSSLICQTCFPDSEIAIFKNAWGGIKEEQTQSKENIYTCARNTSGTPETFSMKYYPNSFKI